MSFLDFFCLILSLTVEMHTMKILNPSMIYKWENLQSQGDQIFIYLTVFMCLHVYVCVYIWVFVFILYIKYHIVQLR